MSEISPTKLSSGHGQRRNKRPNQDDDTDAISSQSVTSTKPPSASLKNANVELSKKVHRNTTKEANDNIQQTRQDKNQPILSEKVGVRQDGAWSNLHTNAPEWQIDETNYCSRLTDDSVHRRRDDRRRAHEAWGKEDARINSPYRKSAGSVVSNGKHHFHSDYRHGIHSNRDQLNVADIQMSSNRSKKKISSAREMLARAFFWEEPEAVEVRKGYLLTQSERPGHLKVDKNDDREFVDVECASDAGTTEVELSETADDDDDDVDDEGGGDVLRPGACGLAVSPCLSEGMLNNRPIIEDHLGHHPDTDVEFGDESPDILPRPMSSDDYDHRLRNYFAEMFSQDTTVLSKQNRNQAVPSPASDSRMKRTTVDDGKSFHASIPGDESSRNRSKNVQHILPSSPRTVNTGENGDPNLSLVPPENAAASMENEVKILANLAQRRMQLESTLAARVEQLKKLQEQQAILKHLQQRQQDNERIMNEQLMEERQELLREHQQCSQLNKKRQTSLSDKGSCVDKDLKTESLHIESRGSFVQDLRIHRNDEGNDSARNVTGDEEPFSACLVGKRSRQKQKEEDENDDDSNKFMKALMSNMSSVCNRFPRSYAARHEEEEEGTASETSGVPENEEGEDGDAATGGRAPLDSLMENMRYLMEAQKELCNLRDILRIRTADQQNAEALSTQVEHSSGPLVECDSLHGDTQILTRGAQKLTEEQRQVNKAHEDAVEMSQRMRQEHDKAESKSPVMRMWSENPEVKAKMNQLKEAKEKFARLSQLVAMADEQQKSVATSMNRNLCARGHADYISSMMERASTLNLSNQQNMSCAGSNERATQDSGNKERNMLGAGHHDGANRINGKPAKNVSACTQRNEPLRSTAVASSRLEPRANNSTTSVRSKATATQSNNQHDIHSDRKTQTMSASNLLSLSTANSFRSDEITAGTRNRPWPTNNAGNTERELIGASGCLFPRPSDDFSGDRKVPNDVRAMTKSAVLCNRDVATATDNDMVAGIACRLDDCPIVGRVKNTNKNDVRRSGGRAMTNQSVTCGSGSNIFSRSSPRSSMDAMRCEMRNMSRELLELERMVNVSMRRRPTAEVDSDDEIGSEERSSDPGDVINRQQTQLLSQLLAGYEQLLADNEILAAKFDRLELIALNEATIARSAMPPPVVYNNTNSSNNIAQLYTSQGTAAVPSTLGSRPATRVFALDSMNCMEFDSAETSRLATSTDRQQPVFSAKPKSSVNKLETFKQDGGCTTATWVECEKMEGLAVPRHNADNRKGGEEREPDRMKNCVPALEIQGIDSKYLTPSRNKQTMIGGKRTRNECGRYGAKADCDEDIEARCRDRRNDGSDVRFRPGLSAGISGTAFASMSSIASICTSTSQQSNDNPIEDEREDQRFDCNSCSDNDDIYRQQPDDWSHDYYASKTTSSGTRNIDTVTGGAKKSKASGEGAENHAATPCTTRGCEGGDSASVHASDERREFQLLQETIYSEVATLIAQNESQPHYLIGLFRDLQRLTTTEQCKKALSAIEGIVSDYLMEDSDCFPSHETARKELFDARHRLDSANCFLTTDDSGGEPTPPLRPPPVTTIRNRTMNQPPMSQYIPLADSNKPSRNARRSDEVQEISDVEDVVYSPDPDHDDKETCDSVCSDEATVSPQTTAAATARNLGNMADGERETTVEKASRTAASLVSRASSSSSSSSGARVADRFGFVTVNFSMDNCLYVRSTKSGNEARVDDQKSAGENSTTTSEGSSWDHTDDLNPSLCRSPAIVLVEAAPLSLDQYIPSAPVTRRAGVQLLVSSGHDDDAQGKKEQEEEEEEVIEEVIECELDDAEEENKEQEHVKDKNTGRAESGYAFVTSVRSEEIAKKMETEFQGDFGAAGAAMLLSLIDSEVQLVGDSSSAPPPPGDYVRDSSEARCP